MRKQLALLAGAMFIVSGGTAVWAGDVTSGLKPGAYVEAFTVWDCTGPAKGTTLCYRCRYGARPVVGIFTRTLDDKVARLIKQLDTVVGKNRDQKMAAFVVLITEDPDAVEPKLVELARKNNIRNVPLTIFEGPHGPPKYKIADGADVNVMMWVKHHVKVNHAFGNKQLENDEIEQVVSDTGKILK